MEVALTCIKDGGTRSFKIPGGSDGADGTKTSPLKARFGQLGLQGVSMKVRSIALGAFGTLTGGFSHGDDIKSDAESCRVLGHAEGMHDTGRACAF